MSLPQLSLPKPGRVVQAGVTVLAALTLSATALATAATAAPRTAAQPARHVMTTLHGATRVPNAVAQLRYGGGIDGIGVTTGAAEGLRGLLGLPVGHRRHRRQRLHHAHR